MSKNEITGDSLRSRELSPEGKENWDRIFGAKVVNEEKHRVCHCAGCSGNCAGHNCEICCSRFTLSAARRQMRAEEVAALIEMGKIIVEKNNA